MCSGHDGAVRTAPGVRALAALATTAAVALTTALPALASEPEWNLARIGAPVSAPGVLVAVVDTGVDASHPALTGRVERAIDLVGGTGGDQNGHGTHVSGTIAGADAGCGNIGVAPDARILPVRVLDADGEGTADLVAEGIERAADAGAAVINLSLGADVVLHNLGGSSLEEAIEYAWAKGSIPVLAAGNGGLVGGIFGSGYGGIPAVVVTATDHRDSVAPYATSIGSAEWGIAAPGGDASGEKGRDVLSAFPGRRCALNAGTSMAAPHVSGALAALLARGHDPRSAVERLLSTASDLGSPGVDATYGHGLLDVRAAVGGPLTPPVVEPPTPDPGPSGAALPGPAGPRRPNPATAVPDGAPSTTAPSSSAAGGTTGDEVPAGDGGDAGTSTTAPGSRPAGASGDGGADGPVESSSGTSADEGDDGPPAGAVVLAIVALGVAGAGSGVAARRFGRGA